MEIYKSKVNNNIPDGEFLECDNIILFDCDMYDKDTGKIVFSLKKM